MLTHLYDASPVWVQNLFSTGYGVAKTPGRFGAEYREYRRHVREMWRRPTEELRRTQEAELRRFLEHAVSRSRHYGRVKTQGIGTALDVWEALSAFPVLSKEVLRQDIAEIQTIPTWRGTKSKTGGTTGKSLTVLFTRRDYQRRMAVVDEFRATHGFEHRRMRRATFNGKHIIPPRQVGPPYWRYNAAMRQMVFSSFHITRANAPHYIERIESLKPHAIDGFVSSIADVARFAQETGHRFKWHPLAIFTTSEALTPLHRQIIQSVWDCPVRDQYASSEGAPFILECRSGRLHFDVLSGVIEPRGGGQGALVTSFSTYGTPLIRYDIGDVVEFEDQDERCDCGWGLPLVRSIQGREVDGLRATSGAFINLGNVSNIFKALDRAVIDAQVIQNQRDALLVKIVTGASDPGPIKEAIVQEIRHKFGADMGVTVEVVDEIPRDLSGKKRLVISQVGDRVP